MLHLRLRVPDDLLGSVVDHLDHDDTVTSLAVLRDAYVRPAGHLVLCDVARENASGVIDGLGRIDTGRRTSLTIEEPQVVLARDAEEAERIAPGSPDDGVVWKVVENQLRNDSRLSWSFCAFLTLASLIAGAGRVVDEPILIVGSMVVGPEFAPLAALCYAAAHPRLAMVGPALKTLGVGLVAALGTSLVFWSVAYHLLGRFTLADATTGSRTDFIIQPDGWSLLIALLAGAAGVLSLGSSKSGPLVGVFISVTTVPAIGTAALTLAVGAYGETLGAAVQLAVNVVGILVAGTLTMWLQKRVWGWLAARPDSAAGHGGPAR